VTLLETRGLSRRFGGLTAVDDVSITVPPGRIVGLIGPNGAGKSTLFSLIAGALRPSDGRLRFAGRDVTGWHAHEAAAAGVGRTFQLMRGFASMTVLENVAVGSHLRHRRRRTAHAAARAVLETVRLDALADMPVSSLTAASRKRLEIARALATEPRLLLLDEVLSGLTSVEQQEAAEVVREVRQAGVTVLLVEHVMEVIMPLCDEVIVLAQGRRIAQGTPDAVARDPVVLDAYLGS
jgi:branched-chain amino acid transport system ATP-binding protein